MIRRSFVKQLVVALLFFFVQGALAQYCDGVVYLKAPKDWNEVYVQYRGDFVKLSKSSDDWYEFRINSGNYIESFGFVDKPTYGYDTQWINRENFAIKEMSISSSTTFTCEYLSRGILYVYENPAQPGRTAFSPDPPDAKYLYVLIPPDYDDWMSSVPMISMDGGKTGRALTVDPERCGWYYTLWFNEEPTDSVLLYRDDDLDREDMIGLLGSRETSNTPTPIPLKSYFEIIGRDSIFFVPDERYYLAAHDDGWYFTYPEGVEGSCSYEMAAIIYDTDALLHPAFSCFAMGGEGCQLGTQGVSAAQAQAYVDACIGVTPGLVEKYLDPSVPQKQRKPKLSAIGSKCFINESFFNQLFNYTPGVNEKSCYNMPFSRASDGKWEFDSDYYQSAGTKAPGGFYPVETTDNSVILMADPDQMPIPTARTKRDAEGPVFYGPALREDHPTEGIPVIDAFCNTSSWSGGFDCEGSFANGDETAEYIQKMLKLGGTSVASTCVLGWSCEDYAPAGWNYFKSGTEIAVSSYASGGIRWNGARNQHFCFESHAKFTYKPGLTFNFRGDDDIWVYIDNTLAVDLGGTHLAAPAYVKLDNFKGYGGRSLVVGSQYDIDIFFCDRRTTMSNVRIKTNMYIRQNVALEMSPSTDKNTGIKTYEMCYTKTGSSGCASAMSDSDEEIRCCGDEILTKCQVKVAYYLVKGMTMNMDEAILLENGTINRGGIDLRDVSAPKIDKDNVTVPAGVWSLFAVIEGKSKRIRTFRSQATVDVMYKTPRGVFDEDGVVDKSVYYEYVGAGLAGEMLPIYITFLYPDEEEPMAGDLYISPLEAVGMSYTLEADGMILYEMSGKTLKRVDPSVSRTIDSSGVDTLYVMVNPSALNGEKVKRFTMMVKGSTAIPATIAFYADSRDLEDAITSSSSNANSPSSSPSSSGSSTSPNSSGSVTPGSNSSVVIGKPSFHIEMTGPFTFEVVVDGEKAIQKQAYAVTDLNGNVVKQGFLGGDENRISLENSGYYIVKIGHHHQVVKFK